MGKRIVDYINQYTDLELRKELATLLGWYGIDEDSQGRLIGKLPGVRSFVPLMIPDWINEPGQVEAIEESIKNRGLKDFYIKNLIQIGLISGYGGARQAQFLDEATSRQRCEAALITFRKGIRNN